MRVAIWFLSAASAALLTLAPSLARAQQQVLVEGNPPLTRATLDNYVALLEVVTATPFTGAQRRVIESELVRDWAADDRTTINHVVDDVESFAGVSALGEDEVQRFQRTAQSAILAVFRGECPDDPVCATAIEAYEAGHRPIAQGYHPLTRQAADAFIELLLFMGGVVRQGEPLILDDETDRVLKTAWASRLANSYPSYSEQQQGFIARMPYHAAGLRQHWSTLSTAEREYLRLQWAPVFGDPMTGTQPDTTVKATTAVPERQPRTATQSGAGPNEAQAALQQTQANHATYQAWSDWALADHANRMNVIGRIGGSNWVYKPTYR